MRESKNNFIPRRFPCVVEADLHLLNYSLVTEIIYMRIKRLSSEIFRKE